MMKGLIGQTVGAYRIIEQIGRGGMATVYKAYQPALDRYVAIKILPAHLADEPGFAERFQREARAVAKLEHPHILAVHDFGQDDELSFIAMRYVETGTLKGQMGRPMELKRIADLVSQIAGALDLAHEHGIVHRDVKPSNVLLDKRDWSLLSDFGLARMMEASQQITASGVGMGTPAYMSPEQGMADRVDHRSDVYSLGVMLYEMLTGRVPYEAETPMAVVLKHIQDPLPLPRDVNPEIPKAVERVVLKAMAKSPDDRFQQAGQLARSLQEAAHPAGATRDQKQAFGEKTTEQIRAESQPIGDWKKRLKWFWWLLPAGLLIALVGFAVIRLPQASQFLGGAIEETGEQATNEARVGENSAATADPVNVEPDSEVIPEAQDSNPEIDLILFDDFESPGQVNPLRWSSDTDFRVENGVAVLQAPTGKVWSYRANLEPSNNWPLQTSGEIRFAVQTNIKVDSSVSDAPSGGSTEFQVTGSSFEDGVWLFALGYAFESGFIGYSCAGARYVFENPGPPLYSRNFGFPDFDEWHDFKISIEETSVGDDLAFVAYIDGDEVCRWVPPVEWQESIADGQTYSFFLGNAWDGPWAYEQPFLAYYDDVVVGPIN